MKNTESKINLHGKVIVMVTASPTVTDVADREDVTV